MALIKCKECGKEISNKVDTCIHCGCPVENKKSSSEDCKITISYPKVFQLNPKIEVYFNEELLTEIAYGSEENITIKEDGILLFKWKFRKTQIDVKHDLNYGINLSWNRITGQLVAKVDSWR